MNTCMTSSCTKYSRKIENLEIISFCRYLLTFYHVKSLSSVLSRYFVRQFSFRITCLHLLPVYIKNWRKYMWTKFGMKQNLFKIWTNRRDRKIYENWHANGFWKRWFWSRNKEYVIKFYHLYICWKEKKPISFSLKLIAIT